MIVCGIIQAAQKNSDRIIVKQVSGESQSSDLIINAKIDLTTSGTDISRDGINGWRKGILRHEELYVSVMTNSKDFLERPIMLGIYLKKEKDPFCVSKDIIIELLNRFSLEMDDVKIVNIVNFIKKNFTNNIWTRNILFVK